MARRPVQARSLFQVRTVRPENRRTLPLQPCRWGAGAADVSLGRHRGDATGEIKLQDGRAIGKASQPNETEGMFPSGLEVRFDVPLLRAGESLPARRRKLQHVMYCWMSLR